MTNNNALTVLVADDNEQNLSVIGNILLEAGYRTSLVSGSKEVFDSLEEYLPDLILLDIMMPEVDGFEICKRLKSIERTREIPVIFLTAKVDTEDIVKGFQLGGVDYITKPFRKEELLVRVKTHIDFKRNEKELYELIRMRDRLFSIIGHDLSGPLGTFISILDKIQKNRELPVAKLEKFLTQMKNISENTYILLENLLNWAKSQQKTTKYDRRNNNIRELIDENIRLLEETAKTKSISLINRIENDPSAYFDRYSISTVIRNLISNAIKFSDNNGKILIECSDNIDHIQISIIDNGIGMSKEDFDGIFSHNKILSRFGTKGEKGTGLGLPLCKEFIEGNKGKIWFKSEPGKGTVFTFTLSKVVSG